MDKQQAIEQLCKAAESAAIVEDILIAIVLLVVIFVIGYVVK